MEPKTRAELERDVLTLAAHARRIEESGRDCTKADEDYMDALFALQGYICRQAASPDIVATRTYMDGDKLIIHEITAEEFYLPGPKNVTPKPQP
jgi:hypothetical protein